MWKGAAKDTRRERSGHALYSSAYLHDKTMENLRIGIEKRVMCERPLVLWVLTIYRYIEKKMANKVF